LGANTKVSCLAQMVLTAKYEHLVVNDSDIRVPGDYLRCLLEPMGDSGVGLVTCLYRGSTASSLGSQLEAACIAEFAAGVLVARQIENGLRFGLGSTLAFRRSDLQKIGGFEAFVDYLADDYELGRRLAEQGLRVKLSKMVVQTFLPAYTMSEFLRHQLRWMRTVRDARPRGYLGLVLTFGLPWAFLALLFAKGAGWAWLLLALTAITRMAMAWLVGRGVLLGRTAALQLLILPLRDVIAVLVWIASFMGHTVTWRGDSFTLKRGKLVRTG
jgi:ceramide glucosyltransferase